MGITMKNELTESEKKKYLLPTERDVEILIKCKELEKMNLAKTDKELLELIKTQLEKDWRKPLLEKLDQLLKKYNQ